MIVFPIDHVSVTSVHSYCCDSYCQLEFSKICLPHPSTTALLMFLPIFKVFSNWKTEGRIWQNPPMTDFYRKINKFSQKIAKCEPCLSFLTFCHITTLASEHCSVEQNNGEFFLHFAHLRFILEWIMCRQKKRPAADDCSRRGNLRCSYFFNKGKICRASEGSIQSTESGVHSFLATQI